MFKRILVYTCAFVDATVVYICTYTINACIIDHISAYGGEERCVHGFGGET
jgi:hypothetical protein